MIVVILLIVIGYLIVIIIWLFRQITANKNISVTAPVDEKQPSIMGKSKGVPNHLVSNDVKCSHSDKPAQQAPIFAPPELPKPSAQIPTEELPAVFADNYIDTEFENIYEKEREILPEETEVISIENNDEKLHQTTCLDYVQIESAVKGVLSGESSQLDRDVIEDMESTELFKQLKEAMYVKNISIVQSALNL